MPPKARHHDLIHHPYCWPNWQSNKLQGFLTNTGRFVNRQEAFIIAQKANQIIPRKTGEINNGPDLFSEDLF